MSSKGRAKNNARVAVKREADEALAKLDLRPRALTHEEIRQLLSVNGPITLALEHLAGEVNVIDPHTYVHRNECHRRRQDLDARSAAQNAGIVGDKHFRKACEIAGIEPTRRQASKFRRGFGLAHVQRFEAAKQAA